MSAIVKKIFFLIFIASLIDQRISFAIISVHREEDQCSLNSNFEDSQIILMQSATINRQRKRQINIYWHNKDFRRGDIIAVYNGKPEDDSKPLWQFEPITDTGFIGTNLQMSLLRRYALTSYKEECLKYCGAWLRDNLIRKVNCLSTHPTWMHDRRDILKQQILPNLMIPGTYMSGLYIKNLPPLESITEKFTITQNQDILTQLVHGVRYLDIPVGHYPELDDKYWLINNKIAMRSLALIIMDVLFFLNGTKEIVILAFRDFSVGFDNENVHVEFVNYIEKLFSGNYLDKLHLNDEWSVTLEEIWNLDRRLIIVYENSYQENRTGLWSSPWSINTLYDPDHFDFRDYIVSSEETWSFFYTFHEELNRKLLRIMYLTIPFEFDINQLKGNCNKTCVDNHPSNSRILADEMAPIITTLYNEIFYVNSNIMAATFIDATGLIDIAITWNERRFSECFDNYQSLNVII